MSLFFNSSEMGKNNIRGRLLFITIPLAFCLGFVAIFPTHTIHLPLEAQSIGPGIGHEYIAPIAPPISLLPGLNGDNNESPRRSNLQLLENGKPLGPAHALHDTIRATGLGAYSHWGLSGSILQFSTSDNSDPRQNGRKYSFYFPLDLRWLGYLLFAAGGALLLKLIRQVSPSRSLPTLTSIKPRTFPSISPLVNFTRRAVQDNWFVLRHLFAMLWRPALIGCALTFATLALYASWPASTRDEILENSVDQIIVRQQFNRSGNGEAANILFLGDSSCLMGIDFAELQISLGSTTVKSLCSMGYVGPAGYGKMLLRQVALAGKPDSLVLFIHPVSFKRDPGWDVWLEIIDAMAREEEPKQHPYKKISQTVQNGLLGTSMFHAMPGRYGMYYGTVWNFARDVEQHGSAIDPGTGLGPAFPHPPIPAKSVKTGQSKPAAETDYAMNQLFIESLRQLRGNLEQAGIDSSRLYLAIAPIPSPGVTEKFKVDREHGITVILNELGMQEKQLIQLPESMENLEFSSATHLNRWGKSYYTQIFSTALIRKLASRSN